MLTKADIAVLFEALEAWERKDASEGLFGALLGGLVSRGDDKMRAEFKAQEEASQRKRLDERMQRQEMSARLKAKLLDIRDAVESKP